MSLILFITLTAGYLGLDRDSSSPLPVSGIEDKGPYERIVSLAPSITEILFALGLGDRIKGVTRYCNYPPEALAIAKIGGFLDPNYEAVVALKPDLVIMVGGYGEAKGRLEELGCKTLEVNHLSIAGILDSMMTIGRVCGRPDRAREMVADIKSRMAFVQAKTRGLPRPRVLISIDRSLGSGTIQDVYIVGHDKFYNTMIELAGGQNAYQGKDIKFPVISGEGILRADPEVIIDMIPALLEKGWNERSILDEWTTLPGLEAVSHGRIYAFSQDFAVRPGPRFIYFLERLSRVIHPEVAWD